MFPFPLKSSSVDAWNCYDLLSIGHGILPSVSPFKMDTSRPIGKNTPRTSSNWWLNLCKKCGLGASNFKQLPVTPGLCKYFPYFQLHSVRLRRAWRPHVAAQWDAHHPFGSEGQQNGRRRRAIHCGAGNETAYWRYLLCVQGCGRAHWSCAWSAHHFGGPTCARRMGSSLWHHWICERRLGTD